MRPRSIRFFLPAWALLLALIAGLLIAGVSVSALIYFNSHAQSLLFERESAAIDEITKLLLDEYEEEGADGLVRAVNRRAQRRSDQLGVVALINAAGQPLAGNVDWPTGKSTDGLKRELELKSHSGEIVRALARVSTVSNGTQLLVGRTFSWPTALSSVLMNSMIAAVLALVSSIAVIAVVLNHYVLSRIDQITRTTQRINRYNLDERIPVDSSGTEFDSLAAELNAMLDRNEAHIDQMKLVTDAIAHDLRLPLQRIRSELTRMIERGSTLEQQHSFENIVKSADGALNAFNGLLEIARAEAGVGKEMFSRVQLDTVLNDVAELFAPVAEDKNQSFQFKTDNAEIWAQETLLKQAIGNVLHNAIKHTPNGGCISMDMQKQSSDAVITITDNGVGIPDEEKARAVQPFGSPSRDGLVAGGGLGLALAAAFVRLHEGQLQLLDADPGLKVVIKLPVHETTPVHP